MLMLAIYPARAITELMLEAAKKDEIPGLTRDTFEEAYLVGLPHYHLIEKIRIHDFHRFGCTPNRGQMHFGGPVKMTASKGEAAIRIALNGPGGKQVIETGNSKVKEQRSLVQNGFSFLDEVSNAYLRLDQILIPYHEAVGPLINKFKELLESKQLAGTASLLAPPQ
jgi:hypothetical protein